MTATAEARAICKYAPNAKTITYRGESAIGPITIEDREDTDAGNELRLVRRTVIVVPTADLASVARHVTVAVGAARYSVRDIRLLDDGELKELLCTEVV